jgi:serine/threonine protein kinase
VRTWKLLVELTDALRFIHAQGVVHLDIKPGNVFIEQGGSVRVGDFGMAARLKRAPNALAAGQNNGLQIREGQKRNEWCSTGVETSLGEPPLVGKDGTFYWPTDNHATTNALSPDSAKQNGQEQQQQHSAQYTSPSPMLERDVEGDREYLSPEALSDDAVHRVGTHSDVYSLGVMLLEAAGNVALPSSESCLPLFHDPEAKLACRSRTTLFRAPTRSSAYPRPLPRPRDRSRMKSYDRRTGAGTDKCRWRRLAQAPQRRLFRPGRLLPPPCQAHHLPFYRYDTVHAGQAPRDRLESAYPLGRALERDQGLDEE